MRVLTTFAIAAIASLGSGAGCTFDSEEPTSRELGGSLKVRGEVVDYKTGMPVSGATLEVSGLTADVAPTIAVTGSTFEIDGVLESSAFQLKASAQSYRPTFGPSVVVTNANVIDVRVPIVSVSYLESLVAAFDIAPPTQGILLARLVKDGRAAAGIGTSAFMMPGGPYFLDANLVAVPGGQVTSASGVVAFFDVPVGVTGITQPAAASLVLDMPVSPIEAGSVTIADVAVLENVQVPTNVSFANTVYPIFERRGCEPCHSANGEGKDLGGLTLGGGTNKAYSELMDGVLRVNKATPEASWLLTYPSRESPPDRHPNITFASTRDPDYVSILVWIREGAKDN